MARADQEFTTYVHLAHPLLCFLRSLSCPCANVAPRARLRAHAGARLWYSYSAQVEGMGGVVLRCGVFGRFRGVTTDSSMGTNANSGSRSYPSKV